MMLTIGPNQETGSKKEGAVKEIKEKGVEMPTSKESTGDIDNRIAVIAVDCKFPGAKNIKEFWNNLKNGVESISFSSEDELKKVGVNPALMDNPNFVKAMGGVLEDKELFDASFFGYSPREAELLNPQTRIFMECAWNVLECAGYQPDSFKGLIGLYAGASGGAYWDTLTLLSGKSSEWGNFAANHLTNEDYLCSQIAYKLNLDGPCFYVQTACSTSLVAVHLACQALINGECDIALAGGVSAYGTTSPGYLYQEGMIFSPDGHCRAFDASAEGTIHGEGAGIAALKLLEDAVKDGDFIYAVIKGTALNNDGNKKVGFTAPSIEGQQLVIKEALQMAEIEPGSVGYIETHGTGTTLGDPIEIAALKLAYAPGKKGTCAIGSVKSNFGHLDNAAGIASLIKTILALTHRQIPPSLHFQRPNPKIDFENSPFFVNTTLRPWKNDNYPLRAGVSSFGVGGTNVHVILEEYQRQEDVLSPSREHQLILLSAQTKSALEQMRKNLALHLKENTRIHLADAAYTLQVGRKAWQYRKMLTCSGVEEAINLLTSEDFIEIPPSYASKDKKNVVFMFPGLGAQYVNMGLDLYRTEPGFRKSLDGCFDLLKPLGYDLKPVLYPAPRESPQPGEKIEQLEWSQLIIFVFEYALAQLLKGWGIEPYAMIGYSFGEYAAACLAGVFSLEDTLKLLITRGRLIETVSPGIMLSVPLPRQEVEALLNEELSLAIDNGPSCVVAGPVRAVKEFEKTMKAKKVLCLPIKASKAIHSKMMTPIAGEFKDAVAKIKGSKPQIPYISNLTGNWIRFDDAISPQYWANHLKETVRFADGVKTLLKQSNLVFLEVGPGRDLSALVKHHTGSQPNPPVINLVKHQQEKVPDHYFLLNRIGRIWLSGIDIPWTRWYAGERRRRLPLPTYAYDKKYYWINGSPGELLEKNFNKTLLLRRKKNMDDWFYIPSWERSPLQLSDPGEVDPPGSSYWLVFCDEYGLAQRLLKQLQQEDPAVNVITVHSGIEFKRNNDVYTIKPQNEDDYQTMVKGLIESDALPDKILHFWGVSGNKPSDSPGERLESSQVLGLHSLLNLVRALGKENVAKKMQLDVIVNHIHRVVDQEQIFPEKATVLGAVKVIPLEYFNINSRLLDIPLPAPGSEQECQLIGQLLEEFKGNYNTEEKVIALRGNHRWVQIIKPFPLKESKGIPRRLREKGVYLILGGLGGMGFTLAEYLAVSVKARLILVGRSEFPPASKWEEWLQTHDKNDGTSNKIKKLREFEEKGAEVMVFSADAADYEGMKEVIQKSSRRFGHINGVIHAAGVVDKSGVIQRRTREMTGKDMASKVQGTLVLERLLQDTPLDFLLLFSSIGNMLYAGKFGQVGYNAANEFLDAYTYYKNQPGAPLTVTINWVDWKEVGMAVRTLEEKNLDIDAELPDAVIPREGIEIFKRILENRQPQVAVSTLDLLRRMKHFNHLKYKEVGSPDVLEDATLPVSLNQRPQLATHYVSPRNEMERTILGVWQFFLGIEKIGINDNFFDLGATSLTMIQVNSKLNKSLGKEIPLVTLFNYPTIGSLAEYLCQQECSAKQTQKKNDRSAEIRKGKQNIQSRFQRTRR
jgi:acyl transferase domain-containing protein/acyl carrier protein